MEQYNKGCVFPAKTGTKSFQKANCRDAWIYTVVRAEDAPIAPSFPADGHHA